MVRVRRPKKRLHVPASYNRNLWIGRLIGARPSSLTKSRDRRANAGEEGTPMLRVVTDEVGRVDARMLLDEIVAEGARRMLAAALEAEVDAYVTGLVGPPAG